MGSRTSVLLTAENTGSSANTDTLRIALVSDPHVTRDSDGGQPLYNRRFEKAIGAVNAAGVDLVLLAGDLTESGTPEEIAEFTALAAAFAAPVRWVYGNHDVGGKHLAGKPGCVTAEQVAQMEAALGPSFFAEVVGGGALRILGVNGSLFGSGLPREADQWAFLQSELAARPRDPAKPISILFCHYPPFLASANEAGGDYWNIEPAPRDRLLRLLKQGGVRAVLSGHIHRPLRNWWEGIAFITTHPVAFGLPWGEQPEGWTLVSLMSDGEIQAEERYIEDGPSPLVRAE